MKVLSYVFIISLIGLIFFACQSEDSWFSPEIENITLEEEIVKMVPFKGDFTSFPIWETGTVECGFPGFSLPFPVFSYVTGNATHLGVLNPELSKIEVAGCELNLETGYVLARLHMTFINKNGDGIYIEGSSNMSITGEPSSGYYEIVEGYGKFKYAKGNMNSSGNVYEDLHVDFQLEGMISRPNH